MPRDYETIAATVARDLSPDANGNRRMHVVADILWEHLQDSGVSWVGFYLDVPEREEMVLGPRRDKPACSPIGMHGACGRAFRDDTALIVRDVKELGEKITIDEGPVKRGNGMSVYFNDPDGNHLEIHCDHE